MPILVLSCRNEHSGLFVWLRQQTNIRQSACTQWEGVKSRSFNTFNGVKQGGVISPILFSIYYDELITRLSSSRYGCRLSDKFVGALAYADDITLLCPSLHGLQEMVNICAHFGTDYHVTFNDKRQHASCLVQALQDVNASVSTTMKLCGQTELSILVTS